MAVTPHIFPTAAAPSAAARLDGCTIVLAGLPRATYVGGDGLVARSDLGGLRLADVPAVFVEAANMRNAADARRVESRRFRRRTARGIAHGLQRFLIG